MRSTADLPDLNVWLALTWPAHIPHRHAVQDWEQQAADQVLFCTVTALGLVRLATPEHNGWEVFLQLLRGGAIPARLCTDVHLAALAMANGSRLVSIDRDVERSAGLERLLLPSPIPDGDPRGSRRTRPFPLTASPGDHGKGEDQQASGQGEVGGRSGTVHPATKLPCRP